MAKFDFITDGSLRESLDADYRELNLCLNAGAWKAVHILAGSIIEAVLVDYLILTNFQAKTSKDPLRMTLEELIKACKAEDILTDKTEKLSSAIQTYRNLIHPGRQVRLCERIDINGAKIAQALVELVIGEICIRKRATYGYTAEQIIEKVERDSSVIAILSHILKEANPVELRRLLIEYIPKRYFELNSSDPEEVDWSILPRFEQCFRQCFDLSPKGVKEEATKKFVTILKEDEETKVLTYETAFFITEDLIHIPKGDRDIVKDHLLDRLSKSVELPLLKAMKGIGKFIEPDEVEGLVTQLCRAMAWGKSQAIKEAANNFLFQEWANTGAVLGKDVSDKIIKMLDLWKRWLEVEKKEPAIAAVFNELIDLMKAVDEIPF